MNNKGFDLSNITIPLEFVKDGGPPRDGIPSIDNPEFINISDADFLSNEDRILGVFYNGISKAYPVRILNFHEIVNDEFDGHPVVVTFCPLCGSGLAFDAMIEGKKRTFGVSGLLYNSDVLLYDRQSETLWPIIPVGRTGRTNIQTPWSSVQIPDFQKIIQGILILNTIIVKRYGFRW
jgi:hypothetical protein